MNKKVLFAGAAIGVFILTLIIVAAIRNRNKSHISVARSVPTAPEATRISTLTDAQRLGEAQEIINGNPSKIEIYKAKELLEDIKKESPEFKQVPALLKKADAKMDELLIEEKPLIVVSSKWEKGGFGTIAIWHVTFHNRSKRSVGNIKFRTAYYAETGSQVDKGGVDGYGKDTVQKVIGPRQKRTIEINDGFVNQEAVRANFELISWEFID